MTLSPDAGSRFMPPEELTLAFAADEGREADEVLAVDDALWATLPVSADLVPGLGASLTPALSVVGMDEAGLSEEGLAAGLSAPVLDAAGLDDTGLSEEFLRADAGAAPLGAVLDAAGLSACLGRSSRRV